MRTIFIIVLSISILISLIQLARLKSPHAQYVKRIRQMNIGATIAVFSNLLIAVAKTPWESTLAHAIYYCSLDWIIYFLMLFALTYSNHITTTKKTIAGILSFFIFTDTVSMSLNIILEHAISISKITWLDNQEYYISQFHAWYYPHLVLDYAMLIFVFAMLIESFKLSVSYYRMRYLIPLVVLVILVLSNALYLLFSLPLDWSVILYPIASMIIDYYAERYTPKILASKTLAESIAELGEGLILFDIDDQCIYMNSIVEKTFGITKETCTIETEPIKTWLNGKALKNAFPFEGYFECQDQNGTSINCRVFIKPISSRGQYLGCYFQLEDVTKEYQTMLSLREAREKEAEARSEAIRASKAKSDFLANMSHEIRTPINAILGMNEMILRENVRPEIQEYARNIQISGDALLSIINDILDFSKIESGKMELTPVSYSPHNIVSACETMILPRIINKNLEFIIEYDPYIPKTLLGDEVRIRQIIINLLTNAAKYTEKGSVTLKLGFDQERLIVNVIDTGIGIKPENKAILFDAFQRIDEKRNRNIEGTGLGLSITNELVRMMHGEISVESDYGKGSTFTVKLPQIIVDIEPSGDYKKISDHDKHEYKEQFRAPAANILAVDDYKMNLTVLKGLLKKTEVNLDLAMSGREAIAKAAEKQYHLILMDHMMPEMDGIETLRIIRSKAGPNFKTPVIMLTANAIQGVESEYLKAGFAGYLTKPINSKELEKELMKYIPDELIEK